jgi:hypothetical protein
MFSFNSKSALCMTKCDRAKCDGANGFGKGGAANHASFAIIGVLDATNEASDAAFEMSDGTNDMSDATNDMSDEAFDMSDATNDMSDEAFEMSDATNDAWKMTPNTSKTTKNIHFKPFQAFCVQIETAGEAEEVMNAMGAMNFLATD